MHMYMYTHIYYVNKSHAYRQGVERGAALLPVDAEGAVDEVEEVEGAGRDHVEPGLFVFNGLFFFKLS